jgi:hypothetical protein
MNIEKKFIILFIIFGLLNIINYLLISLCVFLPGFEKINPIISLFIINSLGIFMGLNVCIIFLFGIISKIVFKTENEQKIKLFLQELQVLDSIFILICCFNIGELIYYIIHV